MTNRSHGKIRSQQTWNEIRRAWERGETGASLALRYDVGLSNLWRRRAAEGWRRLRPDDPTPEPIEGWARYAERQREAFWRRLQDARDLAECLVEAMRDERLSRAPHWHIPWLYHWRAEHRGGGAGPGAGDRGGASVGRGLLARGRVAEAAGRAGRGDGAAAPGRAARGAGPAGGGGGGVRGRP